MNDLGSSNSLMMRKRVLILTMVGAAILALIPMAFASVDMPMPGPSLNLDDSIDSTENLDGGRHRISPWRRKRNAAHGVMDRTPTGHYYFENFARTGKIGAVHFFWGEEQEKAKYLFKTIWWDEQQYTSLAFHGDLGQSFASYLSWVFVQGYVYFQAHQIFLDHGVQDMPFFNEVEKLGFLMSMRHWVELGAPNEYDFYDDQNQDFAREVDLSVREFHESWLQDLDFFLFRVDARRRRLGFEDITLADYLRGNRTPGERAAALEVKKLWEDTLKNERDRRRNRRR